MKVWREAFVTIVAVAASFGAVYGICARVGAGPSPAVMAAVLALTLARHDDSKRGLAWLRLLTLPLVAAACGGVGWALHVAAPIGAALLVIAVVLSIWLRQFGARATAVGRLIALPFVAMLVVPVRPSALGGPIVDVGLIVAAGPIADLFVTLVRWAATRSGFARTASIAQPVARGPRPVAETGITVATRMALQMGVALVAAFTIGLLAFPTHWAWIVLTAFIVCSGALGRGDALYKGLLRLGGAVSGTIAATLLQYALLPTGFGLACLIFAVLFLGVGLRAINYAYWAACITLVLALLQHSQGNAELALLGLRIEAIAIGALCAVAATWWVYPIRTESIVRRRIADVLAALDDALLKPHDSPDEEARHRAVLSHRLTEMNRLAAPVELHRRTLGRRAREHPAVWIATIRELLHHLLAGPASVPGDRRELLGAIRASRRAIGRRLTADELAAVGPEPVAASLRRLQEVLARYGRSGP